MKQPTRLAIDRRKLSDYLLNVSHPEGGPKARLFIRRGFDPANPEGLAYALTAHAIEQWPGVTQATSYGTKHILDGKLLTPSGAVMVRSVWQVRADDQAWFVTAYPI